MLLDIASRDVGSREYPLAVSSREKEIGISEIMVRLLSIWIKQKWPMVSSFYQNLYAPFEIDPSSVRPHFETKTETFLFRKVAIDFIGEEMLEYDLVVRIPPKIRYSVELNIENRRRATPRIVEPEGF